MQSFVCLIYKCTLFFVVRYSPWLSRIGCLLLANIAIFARYSKKQNCFEDETIYDFYATNPAVGRM
jgi:hypothetical protein